MPFNWATEGLADVPEAIALFVKLQAAIAAMPKAPSPAPPGGAPVQPIFELIASVLPEFGALVDRIKAQAAD